MIKKHYRLQITFNFGPDYIEFDPDDVPEGVDPIDYFVNEEYIHDLIQCAIDDGFYDYDITPVPALDEN